MNRILSPTTAFAMTLSLSAVAASLASDHTVHVINSEASGPGSFAQAILDANDDPTITRIQFTGKVGTVWLSSTVVYTGPQPLTIEGNKAIIDGTYANAAAIVANGGGDLTVRHLTVRSAPGEGIDVAVPGEATGTIRVTLFHVVIANNGGHGVLVNDQVDPSAPEPPARPDSDGSAAAVHVKVHASRFIHNGYTVSDRDGLRVNEGGTGDLTIDITQSVFEENAADGVEVDERGEGSVYVQMHGSLLRANGPFDPADLDDGFDIDELDGGSIVGAIVSTKALDNFEEGFDFNENDNGDLRVDMYDVEASRNGEEGIDYEEDDDYGSSGDLVSTFALITANDNRYGDGGLKIREKQAGDLQVAVDGVEANGSGFVDGVPVLDEDVDPEADADDINEPVVVAGVHIRETGAGNASVLVANAVANGNSGNGVEIREADDGDLNAQVTTAHAEDNVVDGLLVREENGGSLASGVLNIVSTGNAANGVNFRESGAGNLTASVTDSSSTFNTLVGVRAEQTGAGSGTLTIVNTTLAPNGVGPTQLIGTSIVP